MNRASRSAAAALIVGTCVFILHGCGGGGGGGIKDKIPPTVTIETPTTAATYSTNATPLILGGTAMDNIAVRSVTWMNAGTGGSGTAVGTGTWTAQIPLMPGNNIITVTASDVKRLTATDVITVSLDSTPPVVTIDTPTTAAAYTTFSTPIALGGTASDNNAVALVTWVNSTTGDSGTAAGTTAWTASVPLMAGTNSITVTGEDAGGNMASDSITVTRMLGEAYAWGGNTGGQLGDGTSPVHLIPTQVLDPSDLSGFLTGIVDIGGGARHSLAVKGGGTARAWGTNNTGQIGDGSISLRTTPVQVTDPADPSGFLTNVASISAGLSHSAALLGDGTIRTWGSNQDGELGDGTGTVSYTPVRVIDPSDPSGFLTGVMELDAGTDYTVALLTDGTVRTWGDNFSSQLGDGTTMDRWSPVQVVDPGDPSGFLTGVAAVAAAARHTVALLTDGTVRTWGSGGDGKLGDGQMINRMTPVQVVDPTDPSGFLTGVMAIAAAPTHTVAFLADGTVRTWGSGAFGKLGDGQVVSSPTPVQVVDPSDPSGFLQGVTGISGGEDHTVALVGGGAVRAWGKGTYGELGNGTTVDSAVPVQVMDPADPSGFLMGVIEIVARANHNVALLGDGTVRVWGFRGSGLLGDGNPGFLTAPARVLDPSDPSGFLARVAAAAGGLFHSVAQIEGGTAVTWGDNSGGQLGDGTRSIRWTPGTVVDPTDPSGFLSRVTGVAAGWYFSAALLGDGTVRSWGEARFGTLGDGFSLDRLTPVQVVDLTDPSGFLTGVSDIQSGAYHTVALHSDGTVRTWGRNISGELGDGTNMNRLTAVQVIDPTDPTGLLMGATAVSAGTFFTVALLADGTVRAWGQNFYGQLGDGTVAPTTMPVQVVDPSDPTGFLTGVVGIAGGGSHTLALKSDGTVRAWGENLGALGDGTFNPSNTPVQVIDPNDPSGFLTGVSAVGASWSRSAALLSDGTVRGWGINSRGQHGDGTTTLRSAPVQVTDPTDPTGFLTGVTAIAAGYYHAIAQK